MHVRLVMGSYMNNQPCPLGACLAALILALPNLVIGLGKDARTKKMLDTSKRYMTQTLMPSKELLGSIGEVHVGI